MNSILWAILEQLKVRHYLHLNAQYENSLHGRKLQTLDITATTESLKISRLYPPIAVES